MSETFDVADRGAFYDQRGGDPRRRPEPPPAGGQPAGHGAAFGPHARGRPQRAVQGARLDPPALAERRGARPVPGLPRGRRAWRRNSTVETFAALRLHVDTWRWGGVPFYIRTGKSLPVTATEVLVELKRPPQSVFGEAQPPDADYFRFRLTPDMSISLGARAKKPGEAMVGEAVELYASHRDGTERPPYQRLIGDADPRRPVALLPRGLGRGRLAGRRRRARRDDARRTSTSPAPGARPRRRACSLHGDRWHEPAATPRVEGQMRRPSDRPAPGCPMSDPARPARPRRSGHPADLVEQRQGRRRARPTTRAGSGSRSGTASSTRSTGRTWTGRRSATSASSWPTTPGSGARSSATPPTRSATRRQGVPAITAVHSHPRYELTLRICADDHADVVRIEARLEDRRDPADPERVAHPLRLYPLLAPHLGFSGLHGHAWTGTYKGRPMLFAQNGPWALALASDPAPCARASATSAPRTAGRTSRRTAG